MMMSPSSSSSSLTELTKPFDRMQIREDNSDMELPKSPRECLIELIQQVEQANLQQALKSELNRLLTDHERLVTMLQQRTQMLEEENNQLKLIHSEHQRRYEKAVREMQFFKKKYDHLQKRHLLPGELEPPSTAPPPPPPPSSHQSPPQHPPPPPPPPSNSTIPPNAYPLTPTSPQHTTTRRQSTMSSESHDSLSSLPQQRTTTTTTTKRRSRSSSTSTTSSSATSIVHPYQQTTTANSSYWSDNSSLLLRQQPPPNRFAANTNSIYSVSTDGSFPATDTRKPSWSYYHQGRQHTNHSSSSASSVYTSVTAPARSTTSANGYTGASMIQQRRVDPLLFGGSDALWDTIAKSHGSDVTVEKIISNFLRRGGSPNTAKQSPSGPVVKYGYGMIHALIVTKAPGSLDLLLQQGANPNAMTLSQNEEDKVTPCYLAASVGWLPGLQKLVQAGGDLIQARGEGVKNKTALHVAAEHCHAAVVEFIVGYTQGALNYQVDSQGATALHYASLSGHTDLVCFLARNCQIPVNQPDRRGEQPIHWAARHGRLEVVTLLVERFGCDPNAYVSKKVPTPLDIAKSQGHKRLVDYLKSIGALTAKKMDKKRDEELAKRIPNHLHSTLARNGLLGGDDSLF